MRIIPISCLALFVNLAVAASGQKVSIKAKNSSIHNILEKIKAQTGFNYFLVTEDLKAAHPVSVDLNNVDLKTALGQILKNQPLSFYIEDKVIIIRKDENKTVTSSVVVQVAPIEVTGKVTDENGTPISGASITIEGTGKGTVSSELGIFKLNLNKGDRLTISHLGYASKTITFKGVTSLVIQLIRKENNLSEIVVIGYGTVNKKDLTGAVATVKAEDVDVATSSSIAQALQGKAAGVQITQATGQPGANAKIQIRSNPSPSAPDILYVVDGVPIDNGAAQPSLTGTIGAGKYGTGGADKSPLNFINPNDIASIEFLKDPSSTSIYGSRAGSGVVLITTKHGKEGKTLINYSGNYGIQRVDKMYPVYGAKDYMLQRNALAEEIWLRDNKIAPYYGQTDIKDPALSQFKPIYSSSEIEQAVDYGQSAMDAITRNAFTEQHNLSMSGGNLKTTYFASANYFNQRGVIIGSDYKRYNGRLNLDHNISNQIKVGANVLVSGSTANNTLTGGSNENGGIITAAIYWAPILPLQAADGSYPISPYYPNIPNPLSYSTLTNTTGNNRILSSAYGQWEVVAGLTAKAQFSYDWSTSRTSAYLPTTFLFGSQVNGEASIDETRAYQKTMIYSLNYNRDIAPRHHLNAVVAYDYESGGGDYLSAANQNFISDIVKYYNLAMGQADKPSVGSSKQAELVSSSVVARAIYTYKGNITVQASIRRDGFSTFAEGKKWGYFPGVSAGWVISNENFFKSIAAVNYLKFRAGYGETGNPLTLGSAFNLYGSAQSPYFGDGQVNTGISLTQAANPNLSWETRAGINAGIDFGVWGNRITGSFDYYSTTNRNLLKYVAYPVGFIINGVYINDGKTRSTGYELSLESKNLVSKNNELSWSTTLNFSHYLNYWLERADMDLKTLPKYEIATGKNAPYKPVYGYQSSGIFKGTFGTAPAWMPGMLPGGLIIVDKAGYDEKGNLTGPDGSISAADHILLGNADPKYSFGLGNKFTFKGFDLNIFLSGMVQHNWSPLNGARVLETQMNAHGWNAMVGAAEPWSSQHTESNIPTTLVDGSYAQYQNSAGYWWINSSYLRCKSLMLGYSLPAKLLSGQKVFSNIRVSIDAQNLFTITDYPGLDPELNAGNYYPLVKSYVFAVNCTF
ncbi:TonB-dependent receptor [Arachidicoccus ginsenosidivorans]